METIIKLSPAELDNTLMEKIKQFIGEKKNINVTISIKEFDSDYGSALNQSIEEAETGVGLISFSMTDFMNYHPAKAH